MNEILAGTVSQSSTLKKKIQAGESSEKNKHHSKMAISKFKISIFSISIGEGGSKEKRLPQSWQTVSKSKKERNALTARAQTGRIGRKPASLSLKRAWNGTRYL